MNTLTLEAETTTHDSPVAQHDSRAATEAAVREACLRVPPLWSLRDYVAVNPFLGFAGVGPAEAARTMRDGLDANALPPVAYLRERWARGGFEERDVLAASARLGCDATALLDVLRGRADVPHRLARVLRTFAQRHDAAHGTYWDTLLVQSHSRWCSAFASGGTPAWAMPEEERLGLFHGWLEAESIDRTLDIAGLRGWRKWIAALPDDASAAVAMLLDRLEIPSESRTAYLYRLLGGVYGWASYFRREPWAASLAGGEPALGNVADLLAIRVCSDAAIAELSGRDETHRTRVSPIEDESVRVALQEAWEDGYARRLLGSLKRHGDASVDSGVRPSAQALFCIDVRSEPMRRYLEAVDDTIETRGFAGFFGVSLGVREADGRDSARCPVLLQPACGVALEGAARGESGGPGAWVKPLQFGPASTFSFVELLGLGYVGKLAADAGKWRKPRPDGETTRPAELREMATWRPLPLEAKVQAASTILKFTGLAACGANMARIVLLCGHGGCSANNAHAAGLDCGACGGHGGGINARIAAGLLNDPAVRERLAAMGTVIPADTRFVPGLHNTTTDVVTLLDVADIPASHAAEVERFQAALVRAGERVRAERAESLGLTEQPASRLGALLGRRSRDWSETRPEWALARNAAFIAARRSRTRGVDLGGRAFLHEYDAAHDADDSILTLILSAPMVVASWINLQYFASTVDNHVLGAGDKPLHNRVGTLGVVLGNGGDLRTGLAKQTVHAADGSWFHEPRRLQVVVEAERARIDAVMAGQPHVRDLVHNGWVRLFALDRDSEASWRRTRHGWERL